MYSHIIGNCSFPTSNSWKHGRITATFKVNLSVLLFPFKKLDTLRFWWHALKCRNHFQLFLWCAQKRKNHTLPLGVIINEEVRDRELLHYTECHIDKNLFLLVSKIHGYKSICSNQDSTYFVVCLLFWVLKTLTFLSI